MNDQFLASTTTTSTMSSTTTIDNVRTNATATSSTTEPAPVITSINPSSISIGSTVTISGTNLNGFEGGTNVTLTNQSGQSGVIEANSYIPAGATTLKITIPASICTGSMGLSGKPCPSYLSITPGTYSVSVSPWGVTSNSVPLIITSTSSTAWQTYVGTGFSIQYPIGFTVVSQNLNDVKNQALLLTFNPGSGGQVVLTLSVYIKPPTFNPASGRQIVSTSSNPLTSFANSFSSDVGGIIKDNALQIDGVSATEITMAHGAIVYILYQKGSTIYLIGGQSVDPNHYPSPGSNFVQFYQSFHFTN